MTQYAMIVTTGGRERRGIADAATEALSTARMWSGADGSTVFTADGREITEAEMAQEAAREREERYAQERRAAMQAHNAGVDARNAARFPNGIPGVTPEAYSAAPAILQGAAAEALLHSPHPPPAAPEPIAAVTGPIDFSSFIPASEASGDIAAALNLAEAVLRGCGPRVEQVKAQRDALLLDGPSKALTAAEAALTQARGDAERVEAILPGLRAKLKAARIAEANAAVDAARPAVVAAAAAYNDRLAAFFAIAREAAADLHQLRVAHSRAASGYADAVRDEQEVRSGGGFEGPITTGSMLPPGGYLHDRAAHAGDRYLNPAKTFDFLARLEREQQG
ncbi:hypothetical protein [Roseomonas chloroacetimidivorans]|uniref:hypothetical protein n=1 Tax=Roseomonas chloroacetimidivorans TaxID=1766656 RepID=UPI003C76F213